MNGGPPKNLSVNIEELESVSCENCDGIYFNTVSVIRLVPALLSRSGREERVALEMYRCIQCSLVTKIMKGPGGAK